MAKQVRRSLFIGIGGTGISTILSLKKRILDVYDPEERRNVPPMIGFLGFDTDKYSPLQLEGQPDVELTAQEFYKMEINNVRDIIDNSPHIQKRLPKEVRNSASSIYAGCGQIRALGAMTITQKYPDVLERLSRAVKGIRDWSVEDIDSDYEAEGNNISIHVIFSTSGGTGSGMFLDIALMLREKCGLQDSDSISAYILLPDAFTNLPGTDNVEPNAYAAFKELDALMSLNADKNIEIDYGKIKELDVLRYKRSPYDFVYTINNRNRNNVYINDVTRLTDFISYALFVTVGALGDKAAGVWDNLKRMIDKKVTIGGKVKTQRYLGLGISELYIDNSKIVEYAANKMSFRILSHLLQEREESVGEAVETFISTNGLSERGKDKNEIIDFIHQPARIDIQDLDTFDNVETTANSILKQYQETIINKTKNSADKKVDELSERVKKVLHDHIDSKLIQGELDYCQEFLESLTSYSRSIVKEMDFEIDELKKSQGSLAGHINNGIEELREISDRKNPFGKRKAISNAWETLKGYAIDLGLNEQEIIRRNETKRCLAFLKYEMDSLTNKVESIIGTLKSARKSVTDQINDAETVQNDRNPFSYDISNDVAGTVIINDVDLNAFYNYLSKDGKLISNWGKFDAISVLDICRRFAVTQEAVSEYTEYDIEQALKLLSKDRMIDVLKQLDKMSVPVWQYNEALLGKDTTLMYLIGVPDKTHSILDDNKILDLFSASVTPALTSTYDKNRIIVFKTEAAATGASIVNFSQYKQKYDFRNEQSRMAPDEAGMNFHIHEDWENFDELIPSGERTDALKYFALGFADPFNFIKKERGKYWIYTRTDPNETSHNAKHQGWEPISDSADRIVNFKEFSENSSYISAIEQLIEQKITQFGETQSFNATKAYMQILKEEISKVNTFEMSDQLGKEAEEIQKYLQEINPNSF